MVDIRTDGQAALRTADQAIGTGTESIEAIFGATRNSMEAMLFAGQLANRHFLERFGEVVQYWWEALAHASAAVRAMTTATSPVESAGLQAEFARAPCEEALKEMARSEAMVRADPKQIAAQPPEPQPHAPAVLTRPADRNRTSA